MLVDLAKTRKKRFQKLVVTVCSDECKLCLQIYPFTVNHSRRQDIF